MHSTPSMQRSDRLRIRAWLAFGLVVPGLPVAACIGAAAWALSAGLWGVAALAGVLAVAAVAAVIAPSHLPAGYRLQHDEADELLDEVRHLAELTGAPHVDAVILDEDFNASIVVVPPRVPVLPSRVVLVLGLPLLLGLTRRQVRAVIVHELAHLAGGVDRFERLVELARHRWASINAAGADASRSGWLLARFARWYTPRLAARTAGIAAVHERYADRVDAGLAGTETAVDALCAVIVRSERLDELWAEMQWWTTEQEEPPDNLFSDLLPEWLQAELDADQVSRTLRRELSRTAPPDADYPAMLDRVHDLGEAGEVDDVLTRHVASVCAAVERPAAASLLGPATARVADLLERRWRDAIGDAWTSSRADALAAADRARELEESAVYAPLDVQRQSELAWCLWTAFGDDRARESYEQLLRIQPDSPLARLGLARLYMRAGSDDWEELLIPLAAGPNDSAAAAEARGLLHDGYLERGDVASAEAIDE